MENHFQNRQSRKTTKDIVALKDGDFYSGNVEITRKTQPGPVILSVSDGYGNVDAVIKDCDFKVGDTVSISGAVNERAGKLQIELDNIKKSDVKLDSIIEKNSEPTNTKFSIESKRFEKLRPYFYKIAKRIRKAVLENQPITIRHHADSDGINAGMAIEQSCKIFMQKIGINPEFNLYRSPSRTPFYDITDVLRDVVLIKRIIEGHGQKKPIIIVLDNGSGYEDVFGLKALKSLGFEIIVIDHHNPVIIKNKKTLVDPYISFHLNPYIEGLDSQTCAGMLAYETARWICEAYSNPSLPAVAGLSDRSVCEELDKYIKNSGKTKKELEEIGTAIDFVAYHLKFNAGKGLFETLYENHELVEIIDEEVRKGVETQLETTLPYLRTQNINGVVLSTIDLEKYTMRFGYPNPGKIVGMIHDTVAVGKDRLPVMTLGYLADSVIIRATKPILPVQTIIDRIKKDIPYSHIGGGGHEKAGTIKFTPAHLDSILEKIKQQIRELNYSKDSFE